MKREIELFFLAVFIVFMSLGVFAGVGFGKENPQLSVQNYDFNNDGVINSEDVNIAIDCQQAQIAYGELPSECNIVDSDGNGIIEDYDLLAVTEMSEDFSGRDYNCNDNQSIFKLSSINNAHASLWNASNYDVKICYDEIFGKIYPVTNELNPHSCFQNTTWNNSIVSLDSKENSHISLINKTPNLNICYGDLDCVKVIGSNTLGPKYKLIGSLSSGNNSHFAIDDSYAIKLYCKSAFAGTAGTCNANGQCEVGEACNCIDCGTNENTCTNNLVCNVESNTCQPKEECGIGETLCSDGICRTDCGDLEVACNFDGICGVDDDGRTESCQCNDCYGLKDSCAENLICDFRTESCMACPNGEVDSETGNCLSDPKPDLVILSPAKKDNVDEFEKFKTNVAISFNQEIINANSLLRDVGVGWIFGKEDVVEIEKCLTENNCDTTKTYDKHGYKIVQATAVEMGGDFRTDSEFTEFLVYKEGLNLFAIISTPEPFTSIVSGEPVEFNASNSFVSECFASRAICQKNDNAGTKFVCYSVGTLWCYDYPKPDEGNVYTNFGQYEFIFNWTFDKGMPNEESIEGEWKTDYDSMVEFSKIFTGEPGTNHTVQLITKYRYDI